MIRRPSLLLITAGVAGIAAIGNGVNAASPPESSVMPKTRLGVAITQDLNVRDQAATRRDRALDLREQAARAAETRLKAELEAGKPADPVIDPLTGKPVVVKDQFTDLAKIYQAMKPASAAIVFEQLDMDVQMKVARQMKERSIALVMASMTPKGAAALSMALARKQPAVARPPIS